MLASGAMLPRGAVQEALSHAYVDAVCARAGCIYRRTWPDFGIDGRLSYLSTFAGRPWEPGIEVALQVKATTRAQLRSEEVRFELDADAYRELASDEGMPRILVVFVMPTEESLWFEQTDEALTLRRCAWWTSLRGLEPTDNTRSVRVSLARDRRFDSAAILGPLRHLALRGSLP